MSPPLRSSEDYLLMGLCLQFRLVSASQMQSLLDETDGSTSVADLLIGAGFISRPQKEQLLGLVERLASASHSGLVDSAAYRSSESQIPAADGAGAHGDFVCPPTLVLNPSNDATVELTVDFNALTQIDPPPGENFADSLDAIGDESLLAGGRSVAGKSFSRLLKSSSGRLEVSEAVGAVIAGYRIEGKIGAGGMGEVYSARQMSLNRLVALKVLPPKANQDPAFTSRFVDEARTLATFTHPNIVQVYDVGSDDGVFWFTMENVRGNSLAGILKEQGRFPVDVAVNMIKQCLSGLDRAARAGIIHRDIKPANILVDDQGVVKLVDFGLAARQEDLEKERTVAGTPYYIAPEQSRGEGVSSLSDQYSLGVTLYQMLVGKPPFLGSSVSEILRGHREVPPPDPSVSRSEVAPALATIVLRMMAKNPADRFPTFQDVFKALESFELREGLVESRSTFLSEGLINIGERSVRNLWANVALFAFVGIGLTLAAIGTSILLDQWGLPRWKVVSGNWGAGLLMAAFAAIMYIAGVRKRILPKLGNVRTWLQAHIAMAISGYFLSMVHSGNFFAWFTAAKSVPMPDGTQVFGGVPFIPFLNSIVFTFVIISGLIGRYIWRDIARQVAASRIAQGLPIGDVTRETHELTLAIFAQKGLRFWRVFHYPMAIALVILTVAHVISIVYYGG